MKNIIIAIDGYSSTGKSSFARRIATEMEYIYIDTGALYRAITLQLAKTGILTSDNRIDRDAMKQELQRTEIHFQFNEAIQKSETFLNGDNVEEQIRSLQIANQVSYVAEIPEIRAYVDQILRDLGRERGVVMDGRDIGTAVFPDAELKIFMTSDLHIRAERRLKDLLPNQPDATLESVLSNLQERDRIDSSRETHPLMQAPDALLLDNSHLTMDQQMEWFQSILPNYLNDDCNH